MARIATTQPATPVKAPTKMELAAPIYEQILAMSAEQLGGKTPRRVFMDRCAAELGMGAAGANTYFQNLKNEHAGEGRYKYAPASQTAAPAPAGAQSEAGDVAQELKQLRTQVSTLNRTVKQLVKATAPAHA